MGKTGYFVAGLVLAGVPCAFFAWRFMTELADKQRLVAQTTAAQRQAAGVS